MMTILTDSERLEIVEQNAGYARNSFEAVIKAAEAAILAKLREQEPAYAYIYEWDALGGVHQSLSSARWRGQPPARSIPVYAATQPAVVEVPVINYAVVDEYVRDKGANYNEACRMVRAAVAAPQPAVVEVPLGYKLVPVKPTPEMVAAFANNIDTPDKLNSWSNGYRAMLAAAPEAPAQGDVRNAEDELNCAEEVLDGYAARLDLAETAFDCIGDYITAVCEALKAAAPQAPANAMVQGWKEALERIADPRNTHFAGDAQVVARTALAAAPQAPAQGTWMQRNAVFVITEAYEAGVGKGMQAAKRGEEVQNPWGDEPCREAWSLGYKEGKERYRPEAPAQAIPTEAGIAWQSGALPAERKAVTVDGRSWYRDDHERVAPEAPRAPTMSRWTERWHGSGPDRGWSIWEMTTSTHGDCVAYVGEGEHSERLTAMIVQKHNDSLAAAPEAPAQGIPAELDVRRILLDVVPGDGSGQEVYAKNVDDVVRVLTELSEKAEAQAIPAPWREAVKVAREFCELAWRDVDMNDYAFERLEAAIAALVQLDAVEGGE